MPDKPPATLTRRSLLAGSAVLAVTLAGCTTGAPKPVPEPPRDPLQDLLDAHVSLLSAYDDAIAAVPADTRLAGLRANTDQHVGALAGALAVRPPSSSAAPGPASGATGPASAPPPDPATLVPALAQQEAAVAAQARELAISEPAERAPLLASIAASHAGASVVLS